MKTVDLATELISLESVSPDRSPVQDILISRLKKIGFEIEEKVLNNSRNFWAKIGNKEPLFVFSGHTDVVPAGEAESWSKPPFSATVCDGKLYGRGSADMKSSIAAMITAAEEFISLHESELPFSLGFLITGDEELGGASASEFLSHLVETGEKISYCLVGEPTSENLLGDTLKIGRRGSLSGTLKIRGIQGHVGYPHLAENALHKALAPLQALINEKWDEGGKDFTPTTLQITNFDSGIASNMIPGEATIKFNFRFSVFSPAEDLKSRTAAILRSFNDLSYELNWHLYAEPFLNGEGLLRQLAVKSIETTLGVRPAYSTAGGISDARFFAKHGIETIEFGPLNSTIHKKDECLAVEDIKKLHNVYFQLLRLLESSLTDS